MTYYLVGPEPKKEEIWYIKVEFAICDKENFTITFINPNGTEINITFINTSEILGKYVYILNTTETYVQMVLTLAQPKQLTSKVNYVVKYIIKDSSNFKEYYFKDNLFSQIKDDYNIQSTWGNVKDKESSIDFLYYYIIYPQV